eukprot:TRINITY_DN13877_c0_g1_i1.p1 TRINITY_DN13877_c0_g1~~TRINITY_DN13877_c0_g1_i1.p1  ORF type:complete len:300 (+),score=28.76 TRINITY_DN13877_c0_g1_i1:47-946(+)
MAAASTSEQEPSDAAKWLDAPVGHPVDKKNLASSSSEEELCVSSSWQFLAAKGSNQRDNSKTVGSGTVDSGSSRSTRGSQQEPCADDDAGVSHRSLNMETRSVKVEDLTGRWLSDIGQDIKVTIDSDGVCHARLCDRNGRTTNCQLVSRSWGDEVEVTCGDFAASRAVWEGDTVLRVEWKSIWKRWSRYPARTWTRHLEALGLCKGTWDSARDSSAAYSRWHATSEARLVSSAAHKGWEGAWHAKNSSPTEHSSWDWSSDSQRISPETGPPCPQDGWGTVPKGKGKGKAQNWKWKTEHR